MLSFFTETMNEWMDEWTTKLLISKVEFEKKGFIAHVIKWLDLIHSWSDYLQKEILLSSDCLQCKRKSLILMYTLLTYPFTKKWDILDITNSA